MNSASIIVPIYNGKQYVDRCVGSVLDQAFGDFELILIDDGSTDDSEHACDQYAASDSRIVVVHQSNGGVSSARNAGLGMAAGDYVAFVDGDDYIRNDLLEKAIASIGKTGADVVSFQLMRLSLGGVKHDGQVVYAGTVDLGEKREPFLMDVVSWRTGGWQACRSLFRRGVVQEHEIKFCETCNNYAEDLGFTLEYLLYARKITFIEDPLYVYDDLRDGSMMNRSKKTCRVDDVNEVSYFLHGKMAKVISSEAVAAIHHQMIRNEIGVYLSDASLAQLRCLDSALRKIRKMDFFVEMNKEYAIDAYDANELRGLKSLNKIFDWYLADLDFSAMMKALRTRRILQRCGKAKARILNKTASGK